MRVFIILFLLMALGACQETDNQQIADDSRALVTVNESPITERAVQVFLLNQGIEQPSEEQLNQAVTQLTEQQLFIDYADKQGIQLDSQQQMALRQLQNQALVQQVLKTYVSKNPISEADIKEEYNKVTAEIKGQLFHVHHLLYRDETDAIEMLDMIKAGLAFKAAEADYLKSHQTMKNVGDIGWVNLRQVPESFAKPLESLTPDSVYNQPVISSFGAHLIYLEAKKKSEPPSFDKAKAGIERSLQQKKVDRFKQLLRAKADIKSAS